MSQQIPATLEERSLTVEALRRAGLQEGRRRGQREGRLKALRRLAARLLPPASLAALQGVKDPDELERLLVDLLGSR